MLKSLHIENIAVIEKTDIDFSCGLNALTGETGAGKSIVIDAINAVLGERTSRELIRAGAEKALVSALFCDISEYSAKILKDNGFEIDEDNSLLISRVLSQNASGSVKINGKPATVSILKEISKSLVNIHGQHDNQSLLNPDNHYIYIDRLAENGKELDEYYKEVKNLNAIRKELNGIETDEDDKRRRTELLDYQIEELEKAQIKVGEVEELKKKLQISDNYKKITEALNSAYYYLNGSDEFDGAVSMIKNAQSELNSANESFKETAMKLNESLVSIEDVCSDIRDFTQNKDLGDIDAEKIRDRLDLIYRLMLKYGNGEQTLLDLLDKYKAERESIVTSDIRANELSKELDNSTERLILLGETLSETRKKAAKDFSNNVTQVLSYLNMPDVTFSVNIKKGRYTKLGCDNVEFLIRTNLGEEQKPLHKIASGGELSRVMLAIKSVLADKDDVDTLIFDEIDQGISGKAAGKVGVQLKRVSKARQVVCVTHLAQIAAFCDNHLYIEKSSNGDRTFTEVTVLDYEERIKEIARIMSGTEITDNLYNSAKELLDRSFNNADL
ncbi:MAG: DNA repair protein RecN [Clostridia bacterium]|nr:DNA repair protein RecN [Clostridia bacterium]